MTTPVSQSQVYARIENGQIIEYPVYEEFIISRGDPFSLYTPVIPSSIPPLEEYQETVQTLQVIDNQAYIHYTVVNSPFESLLALAWGAETYEEIITDPVPAASTIPLSLINALEASASILVQNILDNFAKTKGYSDIASAVSYFNSTVPSFAADASAAINCRDLTWTGVYNYRNGILAGTIPFPSSFDEFVGKLPVLSWAPVPTYTGPTTVIPGTVNTYTITNYVSGDYYEATATYGIATISGDTITLQAGTVGSDTLYINNLAIPVSVEYPAPTITGPSSVAINSSTAYTITNYYSSDTYTVSCTAGTVSISGSTITFVAPAAAGSSTITCNGTTVSVTYS